MFSTLLIKPRAPLSRSHSTVLIPMLESERWVKAFAYDARAGARHTQAASAAILRILGARVGGSPVSLPARRLGLTDRGGVGVVVTGGITGRF